MTEVPPPLIITFSFSYYYVLLLSMCVMQSFGSNNTAAPTTMDMVSSFHSSTTATTAIAIVNSSIGSTIAPVPTTSIRNTASNTSIEALLSQSQSQILSTAASRSRSRSSSNNNTTTSSPFNGTSISRNHSGSTSASTLASLDSHHATPTSLPWLSPLVTVAAAQKSWTTTTNASLPPSLMLLNSTTTKTTNTTSALLVRIHDSASYASNLRYHHHNVNTWGPHFEDNVVLNVTVTEGENVLLDCRVGLLGDKLVSWVRRKSDRLDLLTFGSTNHSTDARIYSDFRYPNNWRLSIRNTTGNDSGVYLCQISTHPPKVLEIELSVQAPRVFIVNSRGERINEVHYKEGSTLQLICTVNNIMSKHINWYRNQDWLNQDVVRGGVNIKTDMAATADQAKSVLRVAGVTRKDGGTYLCSAPPQNASVTVHILIGENPAELYRNAAAGRSLLPSNIATDPLSWILAAVLIHALQNAAWMQLPTAILI